VLLAEAFGQGHGFIVGLWSDENPSPVLELNLKLYSGSVGLWGGGLQSLEGKVFEHFVAELQTAISQLGVGFHSKYPLFYKTRVIVCNEVWRVLKSNLRQDR
jgi:hypothetical protein